MDTISELLPWVLLYCVGFCNICNNTKLSNYIFFFALFIFSAIRYNVGFDYMSYDNLISYGNDRQLDRIEYLQQILVLLSRNLFPQLFFVVNSFLTVYFTKWALERMSVNVSISALAFMCFPLMYTNSMSIVRFSSALALVFYASTFLQDKRYIWFIVLTIISLFLHNGVIVAFLLIPLYIFKIPYLANLVILVVSFIGGEFVLSNLLSGVLPENIFSDKLMYYASTKHVENGMSKIPYLYLVVDLICLLKYKNMMKLDNRAYRYITIFNVGVSLMFLFSFQTTLAARLSMPFIMYFLCLIPMFTSKVNIFNFVMPSQLKKIAFSAVCFILFIYLVSIYNETLGRSQFLPYKVFFLCG